MLPNARSVNIRNFYERIFCIKKLRFDRADQAEMFRDCWKEINFIVGVRNYFYSANSVTRAWLRCSSPVFVNVGATVIS